MTLGFDTLVPEQILDAIECSGLQCTGELLALNSYENRVYRAALEDGQRVVAKFYRPGRWSDNAILEEHDYALRLRERELDVVAPMTFDEDTLLHIDGFRLAIYPCVGGRWPALEDEALLKQIGRLVRACISPQSDSVSTTVRLLMWCGSGGRLATPFWKAISCRPS